MAVPMKPQPVTTAQMATPPSKATSPRTIKGIGIPLATLTRALRAGDETALCVL